MQISRPMNSRRRKSKAASRKKLDLPSGYKAYQFTRLRDNGVVTIGPLDQGYGVPFQFNQIPDYTDFTSLYDGYTIDQIDFKFLLINNSADKYPYIVIAPDYDDSANPATETEVLTMQGVKQFQFSASQRSFTFSVKPRVSSAAYRSAVTTGYTWGKESTICDMNNVDIPHYGVRFWAGNYNGTTPGAVMLTYVTYHFHCIGAR